MGVLNIIGGVVMILTSLGIILSVLLQESKRGGGLEALSNANSYYSQNEGRTRDALLHKVTRALAVIFFIVTILVSLAAVYLV
jgi:preprotein translocase subunit SecG